jgi:hypothetical protein
MDDDLWKPIDAAGEVLGLLFDMSHAPVTPIAVSVDLFTVPLADLDAFDLRTEIAHGLSLSDGLRVDVIDENTLMVIGTDSMTTRGLYLATGRVLYIERGEDRSWYLGRLTACFITEARGCTNLEPVDDLTSLADDLAWVRRRSDP